MKEFLKYILSVLIVISLIIGTIFIPLIPGKIYFSFYPLEYPIGAGWVLIWLTTCVVVIVVGFISYLLFLFVKWIKEEIIEVPEDEWDKWE